MSWAAGAPWDFKEHPWSCLDKPWRAIRLKGEFPVPWLGRHSLEGLFIHLVPPTGLFRNRQITVLHHDGVALDQILARRFVIRVVFQYDEVRRAGGEVDVHQSRQRAQRIMRGYHHVLRLRDG